MPLVVDASMAVAWLLADESDPRADAAFEAFEGDFILVPAIWWFETRNALVMNERRGRLERTEMARALEMLVRLPTTIDRQPNSTDIVELAQKHRLSAYDAAYLELARREAIPLASLDRSLSRAAAAENVRLIA